MRVGVRMRSRRDAPFDRFMQNKPWAFMVPSYLLNRLRRQFLFLHNFRRALNLVDIEPSSTRIVQDRKNALEHSHVESRRYSRASLSINTNNHTSIPEEKLSRMLGASQKKQPFISSGTNASVQICKSDKLQMTFPIFPYSHHHARAPKNIRIRPSICAACRRS